MAHLKVFVNGTPGGVDGTELNATNGLTLDKFKYPNTFSEDTGYALLPLCLRCDSGYQATAVKLSLVNCFGLKIGDTSFVNNAEGLATALAALSTASPAHAYGNDSDLLQYSPAGSGLTVGATNVMVFLLVVGTEATLGVGEVFALSYNEAAV